VGGAPPPRARPRGGP